MHLWQLYKSNTNYAITQRGFTRLLNKVIKNVDAIDIVEKVEGTNLTITTPLVVITPDRANKTGTDEVIQVNDHDSNDNHQSIIPSLTLLHRAAMSLNDTDFDHTMTNTPIVTTTMPNVDDPIEFISPSVLPTQSPSVLRTTLPSVLPTQSPFVLPTATLPYVLPTTSPSIIPTTLPSIVGNQTLTDYIHPPPTILPIVNTNESFFPTTVIPTTLTDTTTMQTNQTYTVDPSSQPTNVPITINQTSPSTNNSLPSNPSSTFTQIALDYIAVSETLNFNLNPRPDPRPIPKELCLNTYIMIAKPLASIPKGMKWNMVAKGIEFGYDRLSKKDKYVLAKAILTTECYLEGYPLAMCQPRSFQRWYALFKSKELGRMDKKLVEDLFQNQSGNKTTPYSQKIEKQFPGYLHKLFRYAGKIEGYEAAIAVLIESMNNKAQADFPMCPTRGVLHLTKYTFETFFKDFKGIIKEDQSKPRLSDDQKDQRVVFSVKNKKRLKKRKSKEDKVEFHFCFIDEKWFYIITKRKKRKYLPPHPTEDPDDVFEPARKIRSRRYPTKVMFMGIVAPPNEEMLFDGKIMMKRVSKNVESKALSYNQQFSSDYHVNQLLKQGEWRVNCFTSKMTCWHLFEAIGETYHLDDDITYDMVCTYRTYPTEKTKRMQLVRLDRTDERVLTDIDIRLTKFGRTRKLTFDDINIHVRVKRGASVEKDVNCDTSFMMKSIHEIGKSIRDKMDWVPVWEPVHLFLDNAGGHGTNEGKEQYERKILYEDYFVILEWQVPNSPETNMMDLGAWMAIQSVVENCIGIGS